MADDAPGQVIRFPVNRAGGGSVYCPPLQIHFPALYRVVEETGSGFYMHYTLSEDDNYITAYAAIVQQASSSQPVCLFIGPDG